MEYHWYEDYWDMPRNLPKGHQFFIGYYQVQRALRFHVENIHTDQSARLRWVESMAQRIWRVWYSVDALENLQSEVLHMNSYPHRRRHFTREARRNHPFH